MIIVIPGAYNAQTGVVGGNVQGQTVTIGAILKVTQRDRRPFPTDSGSPSEIWIDNTSAIGYICKENGPTGTVWDRLDLLGDYIAFGDSDPGPNSDITWGFRPGSLRYARNSEILWICKDNTQGAAVWDVLSSGGSVVSVNGQTGVVQLYLDDLLDVDAPLPNNGDVLTWDSVTSTWIALAPTGGGGTYTVDNGLSASTLTNFQLGGATVGTGNLIRDTYITNDTYTFRIDQTGNSRYALELRHPGLGINAGAGLRTITGGIGVRSSSSESYAFEGISSLDYTQQLIRNATSNNDVVGLLRLDRATSGVPFGGIGASIDFWVEARLTLVPPVLAPTDPTVRLAGIWEVPGAAVLARLSRFDMYGYSNGGTLLNASVRGDGKFVLHQYGQTPANFPGTPVWSLGVDASGNVVEFTGGSSTSYTSDNGITLGVPTANNFRLGGDIITSTTITAGFTTSSNAIRFDAPNYLPTGAGIYNFTGFNLLTAYDASGNSILGSFDAQGAISLKVYATENAFGPPTVPGTGLFIESKDSSSIPFKIKGTVGDTLLFNNSGQLRLHEYDTSTAFSGVSGSSIGILNVDNQGKVFVTPAPSGTGTVTNVATGTGLTGGPITTTGTISLNSKLAPADSLTGNALKYLRVNAGETAVEYASASSSGGILHGTASGTDTYTVTITGATAYADGDAYLIRFTNGNTTSATLNINAQGAVPLYRNNDGELIGGDIVDGGEMLCVYNSTTNRFQVIGTAPNTLLSYVTNDDSVTLTKGMVVYAFGGVGDRMTVKRASNLGDATSAQTVGLVLSTSIAANQKGLIMMQGLLDGIDIVKPINGWLDGDPVYLGDTPGTITRIKPYAPKHLVYLGVVTTASPGSAGRMYVRVQNGYELDELHNVQAQSPANNDTLYYDIAALPVPQWKTASVNSLVSSNLKTGSFGVTVDGVTTVVQPGQTGFVVIPYSGTITGWSITANAVGSIQFDVWKDALPGVIPTLADSIVAAAFPTLTAGQFITSTTLTGWTTAFAAGDVFGFYVNSASTIKNATLTIRTTRS